MITQQTISKLHSLGTHLHLCIKRRHIRTAPLIDEETQEQVGWYTKPADWYLAWSVRTRYGTSYYYDGLEKEQGFKTHKEAQDRKNKILSEIDL